MILGIDLSLSGTGLALLSPEQSAIDKVSRRIPPALPQIKQSTEGMFYLGILVSPTPTDIFARWDLIRQTVGLCAQEETRVLIEGYAFSAHMAYSRAIAELGGIVRYHLRELGQRPIEVAPTSLKKFIAGKGNAEKNTIVKEVYKRWGVDLSSDNLADAFGLAKIGQYWDAEPQWLTDFQIEVLETVKKPPKVAKRKGAKA